MTPSTLLKAATARLEAAGIEDAREDARALLRHALGQDAAGLIARGEAVLSEAEAARFEAMITRRAAREPLSQIIGSVGFWTLDLIVTRDVLTPRSDTETVVEAALASLPDRTASLRILDIATGSGAIALALLSELPNATAIATDICAAALDIAKTNAARNGLESRIRFVETSWADGMEGPFDIIVSNPPYIAPEVIETLEPEVRDFEPRIALDGGEGGLEPYVHLFAEARRLLAPDGAALFEIGHDQGKAVLALARGAGLERARIIPDLSARDRVVFCSATEKDLETGRG
ncbi:peptide chain release factor N(5)-glutamine methyltransferase [Glycocaulis sp.]|uniref:peptide chain release factor N(5)-glutamine methyltransferase n=1 Tax=Glycocaulis sp. TaxID=1969725 RepID=UPI0025C4FFCC|nr:peptide chain release factor N(5)-glutamine methyltransferase [Glycocaulis sp.]MCH8520554.1 peptide chain release factor N(5)-glutamine methyltransferase [Glycocaulis sp.]